MRPFLGLELPDEEEYERQDAVEEEEGEEEDEDEEDEGFDE